MCWPGEIGGWAKGGRGVGGRGGCFGGVDGACYPVISRPIEA